MTFEELEKTVAELRKEVNHLALHVGQLRVRMDTERMRDRELRSRVGRLEDGDAARLIARIEEEDP